MNLLALLGHLGAALEPRRPLAPPASATTAGAAPTPDKLLEGVLKAYENEYKDLNDTWRMLESKAQALASVAGIFIAATFAFARDLQAAAPTSFRLALILAVLLLLLATVAGVAVLFVSSVQTPVGGAELARMVDDVSPLMRDGEALERYCNLLRDQARVWSQAIASLKVANARKSRFLRLGQSLLLGAAGLVTGMVMGMVWSR